MIGLTEDPQRYATAATRPATMTQGYRRFRRLGHAVRHAAQGARRRRPAGRAAPLVAVRLLDPAREDEALRALQFAPVHVDAAVRHRRGASRAALAPRRGPRRRRRCVAAIEATRASRRPTRPTARERARPPARRPSSRAARRTPTAPCASPRRRCSSRPRTGRMLEAGGFQPVEAYDVSIANLDHTLERRAPAADPVEALEAFAYPLTTREVAAVLATAPHRRRRRRRRGGAHRRRGRRTRRARGPWERCAVAPRLIGPAPFGRRRTLGALGSAPPLSERIPSHGSQHGRRHRRGRGSRRRRDAPPFTLELSQDQKDIRDWVHGFAADVDAPRRARVGREGGDAVADHPGGREDRPLRLRGRWRSSSPTRPA